LLPISEGAKQASSQAKDDLVATLNGVKQRVFSHLSRFLPFSEEQNGVIARGGQTYGDAKWSQAARFQLVKPLVAS